MKQIGKVMSLNKLYCLFASVFIVFPSCEKVWEADLKEKALDAVRGEYEVESAVWEGPQPIDINGDGNSSYDYFAEWNSVSSGSPCNSSIHNGSVYLEIPYTIDSNADWGGRPSLARRTMECKIDIRTVIKGEEAVLEFDVPSGYEFKHTGYGEVSLRTDVTFAVRNQDGTVSQMTGPVFIKYIRIRYFGK